MFLSRFTSALGPAAKFGTVEDRYFAPNQDQAIATAYERTFGGKPTDNIHTSQALVRALGEKGFKEQAGGGRLIEAGILYAENTTHAMIASTDPIDTTAIPVFDVFRVNWKTCAGTFSHSYEEKLTTQGSEAKFSLVAEGLAGSRKSHLGTVNRELWITGTPGANQFTALPTWIAETPTSGTVGGINRAVWTFARNRTSAGTNSGTAYNELINALNANFNLCALGGTEMAPTALITSSTISAALEGRMIQNVRYGTEDMRGMNGEAAFAPGGLKFKGRPVFYDEDAISDDARWLNSDVLKFVYLAWAKLDQPVDPANQLTDVYKIYTIGNLICKAPRHTGVVHSIT